MPIGARQSPYHEPAIELALPHMVHGSRRLSEEGIADIAHPIDRERQMADGPAVSSARSFIER